MIRSLAPDELEWFIAAYYDFLGHSNPRGFAKRAISSLHNVEEEANKSFILFADGYPLAGAHVLAPEQSDDNQNLYLSHVWFEGSPADLAKLIAYVLAKHSHEAVYAPLFNVSTERLERLTPVFREADFVLEHNYDLEFDLSDLPPIGMPLVLEAWSDESEALFRRVFSQAERYAPSDRFWAWLKRWRGAFSPDLWFVLRETLDQEPVGYAFYGAYQGMSQEGVEGVYYLSAAGVMPEYRDSSEMLRRVLLSSMHDLASRSPFGRIQTSATRQDPKLIRIFESLGFRVINSYPSFVQKPG